MTPVFKDIADSELSQTKLRFIDEKDPDDKSWPKPISIRRGEGDETGSGERSRKATWTSKQAWEYVLASNYHATPPKWRFFDSSSGDKILRDTGMLLKSMGRAYGKDYAVVGTNREYAPALQNGRFKFLGINDLTYNNIDKTISSYFKRLGLK